MDCKSWPWRKNFYTIVRRTKWSQCNKTFRESGKLKIHMLIHSVEKHTCTECEKSIREAGNLNKHLFIHTGAKPYACAHCNKSFRENGKLKSHMVTQSGEKPHKCIVCSKSSLILETWKLTSAHTLGRNQVRFPNSLRSHKRVGEPD